MLMMSEKKRKRGRPRVAPILSYGSEIRMRSNANTRTIKKPKYLKEQEDVENISRGSTPARSVDNNSNHSRGSLNGGCSKNLRGYNLGVDDRDSEYHYGSDFELDDSDTERPIKPTNTGLESRSISDTTSDREESELDELGDGFSENQGDAGGTGTERQAGFVPFWKLGPAGNLGYRAHTPVPVWLQDRVYPEFKLPKSSDDLLIPKLYTLQAVGIYEVLRHFRNLVRLSPFHFEDFCAALIAEDHSILLSEVHVALLKAIIREEEVQQTHFGLLDQKDSINIALYFVDSLTWPETLRQHLYSDPSYRSTLNILNSCNYPYTSLINRLTVLQFLCDHFLQTSVVREFLLRDGKIRYDDHCRACHKTGDLLCCDSCSAVYHIECANPPLINAATEMDDWTCSVCNLNKLEGVTDCLSLMEASGLMCRQEPLGYDRHGRKYWFLVRRIFVESENGDVDYYSTLDQFDLLIALIDGGDLEESLFFAFKEFGDDIRRQMEITETLTEKTRGNRIAQITIESEESRIKIEEIKSKPKAESVDSLNAEVKEETDEVASAGPKVEAKGEEALVKEEIKEEITENCVGLKDAHGVSKDIKEEKPSLQLRDIKPVFYDEDTLKTMAKTKLSQLQCSNHDFPYRFGCSSNYRSYNNHFVANTLALNKVQHNEERDKKRHLSHKFSLANGTDFKWCGTTYGSKESQLSTVRQTLLSLEQNISQHFFHPNWHHFRKLWNQAVGTATKPAQFAKVLLMLVSGIKPSVFVPVWYDALGYVRLKRITALDREDRKKQEKKERKESDDEAKLFPFVKYTRPIKHQLWKMKGEEYRMHGLWGWQWLSAFRRTSPIPIPSAGHRTGPDKFTLPIKSAGTVRGLPISWEVYKGLRMKSNLKALILSPNQLKKEGIEAINNRSQEILVTNAGTQQKLEIVNLTLEDHFEDGLVNVSKALNCHTRLVYPKIGRGSTLDSLLTRRLSLKLQEERDLANKLAEKSEETDAPVDVVNEDSGHESDDSECENIEELPDSQRIVDKKAQGPTGNLLKEMRNHKLRYEALDKTDEYLPCYSPLCRGQGRTNCYSPSCMLKEKVKQKLINSVNSYKIVSSKEAPFDTVGSCSPIRLRESEGPVKRPKVDAVATVTTSTDGVTVKVNTAVASVNGQAVDTNAASAFEASKHKSSVVTKTGEKVTNNSEMKLAYDEDSSNSLCSTVSEQKLGPKEGRIYSAASPSGKIYLKKSNTETKKSKKVTQKLPQSSFRVSKDRGNDATEIKNPQYTIFCLPFYELKMMARKAGRYNPAGFNIVAKSSHYIWPYPCSRPNFKITWLYRTVTMPNISSVAYQLRIIWACLRWDDMHEKGQSDGRKQITTDAEIVQTEILKRKYGGRFLEKTDYLRRKVTIPLDIPKTVREFTPSQRSGLRKRKRAHSPVSKQPESVEEWVEEEKLDLWEVRYFGERMEKAVQLSKKTSQSEKESTLPILQQSTSPSEFKAKIEEQLKIQRETFNQKKSLEQSSGIIKVAIGSALPKPLGNTKSVAGNKIILGGSNMVTVGTKLPTVVPGRKIVTTKGRIISVQTTGTAAASQSNGPQKFTIGKNATVFPVSTLPKVQVTSQGNRVIKLQSLPQISTQSVLPRVSVGNSPPITTSVIRPLAPGTSVASTNSVISTASTITAIRSTPPGQPIHLVRLADGQLQVKGLQNGQQLIQKGDGKIHLLSTKSPQQLTPISQSPIQVTQQMKTVSGNRDLQIRGVSPLASGQVVKINGQQMILRTSANGKQLLSVSSGEISSLTTSITGTAPKLKAEKASDGFTLKPLSPPISASTPVSSVTSLLREKQPQKAPSTPTSPSKANTTPSTLCLRVQVRMTDQGPKTIIQGLQPGVGLTKDHIMAIQQQVRSMLAKYNLQVNQLSPLMTLTIHSGVSNKAQPAQTQQTLMNQAQPINTSQPQPPQMGIVNQSANKMSPTKAQVDDLKDTNSVEKTGSATRGKTVVEDNTSVTPSAGGGDAKDSASLEPKKPFVVTNDYIQQTIKSALNNNDLTPDVEEKLVQLQKFTNEKSLVEDETDEPDPVAKGVKRPREEKDENEYDNLATKSKYKRTERPKKVEKLKNKKDVGESVNSNAVMKAQLQDAKKRAAKQQKLDALLSKHKDLLKKDVLKKRALLEKELQIQIHKELAVAKKHFQILEKIKAAESTVPLPPSPKKKSEVAASVIQSSPAKETTLRSHATKKTESHSNKKNEVSSISSSMPVHTAKTTGSKGSASKTKKSNKSKSKKIVCICRTPFDDTKFYVGCDLCGNWFHGDCVGITEALSRSLSEYVCDDCANAKLNKDLFCFCKQPYDETQFYICCERCEDWYHGKCIGIMQTEADDIDDYICPKCDPNNEWNRPCQKKLTAKDYVELRKVAKNLVQHKNAWPFLEPVDQSEVPDYYKVVKEPMDLKAIDQKVSKQKYENLAKFVADVMLVFDNCRAYNPPNSSFCSCAQTLEVFFCQRLRQLKQKLNQKS